MTDLLVSLEAARLRDTWQGKCLREAKGKTAAVLLVVLAMEWPTVLPLLLRIVFPGFTDIQRPFLRGYAWIMRNGAVVCQMVDREGRIEPKAIYRDPSQMMWDFRRLADKLKLGDEERAAMFVVLRKWLVRDLRVNHEGRKLAS